MKATPIQCFISAAMLATLLAWPADAKDRRASSKTGPLIMSGTMAPPTQARRAHAQADKCVPVTVRRRSLSLR